MKNIINFIFSLYFTFNFINNFNQNILIQFSIYLFIDNIYFIFYEKENKLKYDIIIHHTNCLLLIYSTIELINYDNHIKYNNLYILFSLQEITTIIISLKNIVKNEYKKYTNLVLQIIWIPLRIILPFTIVIYSYMINNENNIYFRLKIFSQCILLLLNTKWTLIFLKIIKSTNHYSSMLLLIPIIFMEKDNIIFHILLFLSLNSFLYNNDKKIELLALDTSFISIISLKFGFDLDIYKLICAFIVSFVIKYNYIESELHSILLFICIFKKSINNLPIFFVNALFIIITFFIRHYTKKTFLWHLSSLFIIISGLYLDNKLIF